jgi:hypothetical protein
MPLCRCTSASKADQVSGLSGAMVYDDSGAIPHFIPLAIPDRRLHPGPVTLMSLTMTVPTLAPLDFHSSSPWVPPSAA